MGADDGSRVGEKVEHTPLEHRASPQSESRTHSLSIEQGVQFGPPQSTSLSPLSFSPFVQAKVVGALVEDSEGLVDGKCVEDDEDRPVGLNDGELDGKYVGSKVGENVVQMPLSHEPCLQSESRAHAWSI